MKGMAMLAREIVPGHRFVAVRNMTQDLKGRRRWDDLRIETVEAVDSAAVKRGDNARVTLRSGPETREVMVCHTGVADDAIAITGWRTVWTEPLPADDREALAYVGALLADKGYRDVALLWIGAARGVEAYAHLITDRVHADEPLAATEGMHYAPTAIGVLATEPLEEGSLVAASMDRAHKTDGRFVLELKHAEVIRRNVSLKDAVGIVPVVPRIGRMTPNGNLASWHDIDERFDEAQARSEPSEALVLAWGEGRELRASCLGKRGIAFWHNDDPEPYAEDGVPGPGLWLWSDVAVRGYVDHEGGHDMDMTGDWTPAKDEDIKRLFGDPSCLDGEISEHCGEDPDGAAQQYMAMAQESDDAERRAEEQRASVTA